MKKTIKALSVMSAVAMLALTAVSCGTSTDSGTDSTSVQMNSKQVYAMSALSSALYLNGGANAVGQMSFRSKDSTPANERPAELGEDVTNIKSYLKMFEGILLDNGLNESVTVPNETDDGEYASYQVKMTVVLPTISGESQKYIMYYNEIPTNTQPETPADPETAADPETPVESEIEQPLEMKGREDLANDENELRDKDEHDKGEHDEHDDDEDEDKVSTTLSGVLIANETVFTIDGKKTVEVEGNETEVEIEFTTASKENPKDFIVVKQETEENEIEYVYSVYKDGRLAEKTKVERELEDNAQKFNIQFVNISDEGKLKEKYSIKKVPNTVGEFTVMYFYSKKPCKIYVKADGENYIFTYRNGFSEVI